MTGGIVLRVCLMAAALAAGPVLAQDTPAAIATAPSDVQPALPAPAPPAPAGASAPAPATTAPQPTPPGSATLSDGQPETAPAGPAKPPEPVQVQSLGQLDLFSTGRDTGLGQDVWKGASADLARRVLPLLATRPLSPAAAALARRLLAQGATAPSGAGEDLKLAIARGQALLALGDADDATLVFDRTPGVADNPELARLAVEAALVAEEDDKACRIAANLTTGRNTPEWLRLRAFCQVRAGKPNEAQLTLELAGGPGKDPTLARLLGTYVAGAGDPGPASLRTALEFAVSRALKLDLEPALPSASPAISGRYVLKNPPPTPPAPDLPPGSAAALIEAASVAAAGEHPDPAALVQLIDRAGRETEARARERLEAAAALLVSLGVEAGDDARARFAGFEVGRTEAPVARILAMEAAADAGRKGEMALLALETAGAAGAEGPGVADRCWIVRALRRAGLSADARAFAAEGLDQLGRGR